MSTWRSLLCLLILFFAACDSNAPEEVLSSARTIQVLKPLEDLQLRYPDTRQYPLHEYFQLDSTGARLLYSVTTEGNSVVSEISGDTLTIQALEAPGESAVVLQAKALEAMPLEVRIGVDVICSVSLAEEEVSYFPNEVGARWAYNVSKSTSSFASPFSSNTTGVLNWEITSRTEECTEIRLQIQETFEGTRENFISGSLDTTITLAEENTFVARLVGDRLLIPEYTDPGPRRLDSLLWIYPSTAPEIIEVDSTISCGFGGCRGNSYRLQRNVGLTYWYSYDSSRSGRIFNRIEFCNEC